MKKNIKEAIDYTGLSGERIPSKSEEMLRKGSFPLANVGLPNPPKGSVATNFVEFLASESFRNAVLKLKQYTGLENLSTDQSAATIYQLFSAAYNKILQIESQNIEYLQDLAVDIVYREFGIDPDEVEFDAKLGTTKIAASLNLDFEERDIELEEAITYFSEAEEYSDDLLENVELIVSSLENFEMEKQKRRLINSIIHGAARRGENLYHLLREELNAIHPDLFDLYCVVMSFNNYNYWMADIDLLQNAMSNGGQFTGVVKVEQVDDEDDNISYGGTDDEPDDEDRYQGGKLRVVARATMFPVLLHELVKGVYEVLGTSGLLSGRAGEIVVQRADNPREEIWDLRLGPVIYSMIMKAYPAELFDEQKRYLQHFLTQRFFSLPANEFLVLAKLLLSGSASGTKMLQDMVNEIIEDLKEYETDQEETTPNKFTGFDLDDDEDDDEDDELSSI